MFTHMDNCIYTNFIFCSLSIRPCIHNLCIQVFKKEKKSYLISVLNTYLPFMIVFYYKANILPFFEKNIEFLYIVNAQKKKNENNLNYNNVEYAYALSCPNIGVNLN